MVLHDKHPLLRKVKIDTLKGILEDSQVVYLEPLQHLYKVGAHDTKVYFVLFGRILLKTADNCLLGRRAINLGWTLGEEILFDSAQQTRQESVLAYTQSCLLGIPCDQLSALQQKLLEQGDQRDYFILESLLKGNFLVKDEWRRQHAASQNKGA